MEVDNLIMALMRSIHKEAVTVTATLYSYCWRGSGCLRSDDIVQGGLKALAISIVIIDNQGSNCQTIDIFLVMGMSSKVFLIGIRKFKNSFRVTWIKPQVSGRRWTLPLGVKLLLAVTFMRMLMQTSRPNALLTFCDVRNYCWWRRYRSLDSGLLRMLSCCQIVGDQHFTQQTWDRSD